jgi:tripartite-type tricarboxylate transporter receptor subunit TctC
MIRRKVNKMKRIERKKILARISMCLVAVMIMFITAGCQQNSQTPSGTEDSQSDYPAKGITLIVPFAAGGGMDTTGRLLAPALEKQLGTTATIINKEGSYGWLGWTELNQAAPDGYTLGLANFPAMITGYLDPTNDVGITVKEYTPIANVVSDINILVAKKDETRFTNLEELLEYSKNNVIKAADTASAGDDHVALLKVNKEMGTNWSIVHFPGAAEAVAAVMGGHIDLLVCNIGEVAGQVNDG